MGEIQKIASFQVDHTVLEPGIYVSRVDGDITTFDLRTRKPNTDSLITPSTMHTLEHMFATFIRNSSIAENVVYFGPMGCQTGFYLLTRNVDAKEVFEHVFADDIDPEKYVEENGLKTVNDEGALRSTIEKIVEANPQSVEDYRNGKKKAIGFLVGQTMKEMKGKADPGMINQILTEILEQ